MFIAIYFKLFFFGIFYLCFFFLFLCSYIEDSSWGLFLLHFNWLCGCCSCLSFGFFGKEEEGEGRNMGVNEERLWEWCGVWEFETPFLIGIYRRGFVLIWKIMSCSIAERGRDKLVVIWNWIYSPLIKSN